MWFRLCLDAIIEKGIYFFSAGVEQDSGASLPHKFLMFGFGFFILITVSAYVANLAAFLTQSGISSCVGTMKEVVEQGTTICAPGALEEELIVKWPKANWRFAYGDNNFHGVLDKYERNECEVLAIGREDTTMDTGVSHGIPHPLVSTWLGFYFPFDSCCLFPTTCFLYSIIIQFTERMCGMGLVYTDSLIIDNAMAFPIKPELGKYFRTILPRFRFQYIVSHHFHIMRLDVSQKASGFSYWMYTADKYKGISIESSKEEYKGAHVCKRM